jgi:site-specific DNA-methyltransferase (adenine-specific)
MKINEIYNMDFRDGIKQMLNEDIKIDMIITDPPYNIDFKYDVYNDKMSDDDYMEMLQWFENEPLAIIQYPEETMKYIVPALGIPNEVLSWCYNSNISRQFRLISIFNTDVDFNAVKQPYKNPTDKRIQERIANGHEGAKSYDWFTDIQLVKNVSNDKTEHPCPVPVELMERIILLTTQEGDIVLDPFMGSGTVAIACKNTNRNYIGFEVSENYYEIAKKRIANWTKQESLLNG